LNPLPLSSGGLHQSGGGWGGRASHIHLKFRVSLCWCFPMCHLEWCCSKPHHRPNDRCWNAKDLMPGQLPLWMEAETESSRNSSASFGARPNSLVVLPLDLEMVVG
jgi:hypothetical protein